MSERSVEIICSACGDETFMRREPVYDGFAKAGEKFICVSCGYEFANEEDVPFKEKKKTTVFNADDAPRRIDVFHDNEKGIYCRCCRHYIVNPFTQRCGLHEKPVEATDTCEDFEKAPE